MWLASRGEEGDRLQYEDFSDDDEDDFLDILNKIPENSDIGEIKG